ncbi:MAG TPA: thiamine phosphate synthase [Xanthobacteraceae bacterium]|jgi:thiamine-phosphate pyrophosphorylase|nr:thiamine phosphate synthase [Xanthobacteraceae bacterium]
MVDLRLYAILDPECAGGRTLPDIARSVASGGATLFQLRDKLGTTREMIERARAIRSVLAPAEIPLVINDRVDVALAAGAEGVHIGWDDMSPLDARQLLGPKAIIGLSIKTIAQVQAAPLDLLDYVCIGGVYATTSKDNPDPPVGIPGLRTILSAARERAPHLPIGAIAGINESNAGDVVAAGADGVAVISALSITSDPAKAARRLREIVDQNLLKHDPEIRAR